MGALPLEGSQPGRARKSAFRPAAPLKVPPTQAGPKQGSPCPAGYVLCGPGLLASSQHPSVKECVTCTWRKPSLLEVSQVQGKGHPWGQSEGGGELPPGTLRGEACRSSSDLGPLANQSALPSPAGVLSSQKEPLDFTPTTSLPPRVPPHRPGPFRNKHKIFRYQQWSVSSWEMARTFLALPAMGAKVRGRDSGREQCLLGARGGRGTRGAGRKANCWTQVPAMECDCSLQLLPGLFCGEPQCPHLLQPVPHHQGCLSVPGSLVDTGRGCSQSQKVSFKMDLCPTSTPAQPLPGGPRC